MFTGISPILGLKSCSNTNPTIPSALSTLRVERNLKVTAEDKTNEEAVAADEEVQSLRVQL